MIGNKQKDLEESWKAFLCVVVRSWPFVYELLFVVIFSHLFHTNFAEDSIQKG